MRSYPACITITLLLLATGAAATTHHVDLGGGGDFLTIQAGLDAASAGDTVLVAAGTYSGAGNRDLDFNGVDLKLLSAAGAATTIIDVQGSEMEMHRGVYFHRGETTDAVVDGFTIRNGGHFIGGGICCAFSSATIRNCVITQCGFAAGAGIYCQGSAPVISDCVITDNHGDPGGGLHCNGASPEVTDCEFSFNSGIFGGGIMCVNGGTASFTDVTVSENVAENNGGGMYNEEAPSLLTRVTFAGNYTTSEFGIGGGMQCNGPATLDNCSFIANSSVDGGGLYCDGPSLILTNCVFKGNSAPDGSGGGMSSVDAWPQLFDVRFEQNLAVSGGGINIVGGAPSLNRVTLYDNESDFLGGGMFIDGSPAMLDSVTFSSNSSFMGGGLYCTSLGTPRFSNATFDGNTAESGAGIYCSYETTPEFTSTTIVNSVDGSAIECEEASPVFARCIIAYTGSGPAFSCDGLSFPDVSHCCLHGNSGGNTVCGASGDNLLAKPRFCLANPDDFSLGENSPCLARNNDWAEQIGAHGEGSCGFIAVPAENGSSVSFVIHPASPNPFTDRTDIQYQIFTSRRDLRLGIYDLGGRLVRTVVLDPATSGLGRFRWDGRDDQGRAAASGVYNFRIVGGGETTGTKIVLIR
ncbi:MAG: FlgD immunoglobulin-like domain containing protein [bacterium]